MAVVASEANFTAASFCCHSDCDSSAASGSSDDAIDVFEATAACASEGLQPSQSLATSLCKLHWTLAVLKNFQWAVPQSSNKPFAITFARMFLRAQFEMCAEEHR